jgi:hypothetical protein
MQLYTTLERIRSHSPCIEGWRSLLRYLNKSVADSDPLEYITVHCAIGFEMTLWACRAEPNYNSHWQEYIHWALSNCSSANTHTIELLNQPQCIAAAIPPWNSQSVLQRLLLKPNSSQSILPITLLLRHTYRTQLENKFLEIINHNE